MFIHIPPTLATSMPVYAFRQSDSVGKAIVILLLIGSVFTWTIMIEKGLALYRAKQATIDFFRLFRNSGNPLKILHRALENQSPVSKVYQSGVSELLDMCGVPVEQADLYGSSRYPEKDLSSAEVETIRSSLERAVADQILRLEDRIGLLATAVSVSPFFGLFGTVWGVMRAFCGMAQQGNADIGAIAPGVSGALLTTVVGLLVAIPSLIGYNLLTNTIRQLTVYMDNFVEEFMVCVRIVQHENTDKE